MTAAGNRTSMTDLSGTHNCNYDDLHRLMSAAHPAASFVPTKNEVFTYDALSGTFPKPGPLGGADDFTYKPANGALASLSDPLSRTTNLEDGRPEQRDPQCRSSRQSRNRPAMYQRGVFMIDRLGCGLVLLLVSVFFSPSRC